MSIAVETSKLIVEYLKNIVPDVEVRRSYLAVLEPDELEELGKIALCIVPMNRNVDRYTVGNMQQNELAIDICINAKLNHCNDEHDAQVAEIDELLAFAEKIYSLFLKKVEKNSGHFRAAFNQPEHVVLCDIEAMERNCFLSVVRVNAVVLAKPEV